MSNVNPNIITPAPVSKSAMKAQLQTIKDELEAITSDITTIDNVIATLGDQLPVGVVLPYGGTSPPSSYVLCYGQELSQTVYDDLYAAIGTTFNTGGETSGYFRVPDLRGRAIIGKDDMGGSAANRVTGAISGIPATTLGAKGGDQLLHSHSHSINDPGHSHAVTVNSGGIHTHFGGISGVFYGEGSGGNSYGGGSVVFQQSGAEGNGSHSHTASSGSTTTGVTTATAGAGSSQNMQPSMVFNWVIKAYAGSTGGGGGTALLAANNLSDVASAATARTNLGLSPVRISVPVIGIAPASAHLIDTVPPWAMSIAASLTGFLVTSHSNVVNATASTVYTVQKNGASIGTITIAAGTNTATLAGAGGTFNGTTDRLSVVAPSTPDATHANFSIHLLGTRT